MPSPTCKSAILWFSTGELSAASVAPAKRGRPWYYFDTHNASQFLTLPDGIPLTPLIDLSRRIHVAPELGYQEHQASRWVGDMLADGGFDVWPTGELLPRPDSVMTVEPCLALLVQSSGHRVVPRAERGVPVCDDDIEIHVPPADAVGRPDPTYAERQPPVGGRGQPWPACSRRRSAGTSPSIGPSRWSRELI